MRNDRRIGEAIMIASGIGLADRWPIIGDCVLGLWRASHLRPRRVLCFLALVLKII